MQEQKWLVAICAGWQQEHSIRTAKSCGFKVIAFDGDSNAVGKKYAHLFFPIDVKESTLIIKKIIDLSLDVVCAVSFISDVGMVTAGAINDFFGTGGMSAAIAKKFTDKKIQREALDCLGGHNPKWLTVKQGDEFCAESLANFGERDVVVKPVNSAGSKGITKLEHPYYNLQKALLEGLKYSDELIIEEFITGTEFSVETFWINGSCEVLAISERTIEGYKTATAIKSVDLDEDLKTAVVDAVEKVNIELGISSGPAHTELIVDCKNNIYILETAARGGGFGVFDKFVPKITGIDHTARHIRLLMGLEVLISKRETSCKAVLHFLPSRRGVIESIDGFESLETISGVSGASFVVPGDITSENQADSDRIGYILISGPDGINFQDKLCEAMAAIKVVYK